MDSNWLGRRGRARCRSSILASSQQATLDDNKLANGQFDGNRISVDQAAAGQTSINGKWTGSVVAASVGIAAIGLGVWLIAGDRADVALLPSWEGVSVVGRF